jgi:hypothetical protein
MRRSQAGSESTAGRGAAPPMRFAAVVFRVWVAALVLGGPADLRGQAPTKPLAAITGRRSVEVAPGLQHTRLVAEGTADTDRWEAHLLAIDLARYRIDVSLALGQVVGRETVTSRVARTDAAAGVNGGFFVTSDPEVGDPAGFVVVDGEVVSAVEQGRPAIGFCEVTGRQEVRVLRPVVEARVEPSLPAGVRPGLNRARKADDVVLYTALWGRSTLTSPGGVEVEVQRGLVRGISDSGSARIPDDGFVLSASGVAAGAVRRRYPVGTGVDLRLDVLDEQARPVDLTGCDYTTAGPVIAEAGHVRRDYTGEAYREGFVVARHPRTAVGVSADGARLLLFVIDGRQAGYSAGATLVELAELLVAEGARTVYNLDGGGSTTMVLRGEGAVNRPSDGSERRPSDMLLVRSRR